MGFAWLGNSGKMTWVGQISQSNEEVDRIALHPFFLVFGLSKFCCLGVGRGWGWFGMCFFGWCFDHFRLPEETKQRTYKLLFDLLTRKDLEAASSAGIVDSCAFLP